MKNIIDWIRVKWNRWDEPWRWIVMILAVLLLLLIFYFSFKFINDSADYHIDKHCNHNFNSLYSCIESCKGNYFFSNDVISNCIKCCDEKIYNESK